MPTIRYEDNEFSCTAGSNLRKVLLKHGTSPYHRVARVVHCRGFGTCGTCSVEITGEVSPPTAVEKWRLSFHPHRREDGLRLACQVKVLGNLEIRKHAGFWGQHKPPSDVEPPSGT